MSRDVRAPAQRAKELLELPKGALGLCSCPVFALRLRLLSRLLQRGLRSRLTLRASHQAGEEQVVEGGIRLLFSCGQARLQACQNQKDLAVNTRALADTQTRTPGLSCDRSRGAADARPGVCTGRGSWGMAMRAPLPREPESTAMERGLDTAACRRVSRAERPANAYAFSAGSEEASARFVCSKVRTECSNSRRTRRETGICCGRADQLTSPGSSVCAVRTGWRCVGRLRNGARGAAKLA